MGEQPRKSGTAGFGIAGKPGYTRVPDPVDGLSYHRTLMRLPGQDPVTAYPIASFAGENINSSCVIGNPIRTSRIMLLRGRQA